MNNGECADVNAVCQNGTCTCTAGHAETDDACGKIGIVNARYERGIQFVPE